MELRLQGQIEDLEAELQSILLFRRRKVITKAAYTAQKKKLMDRQDKLEDRLADIKYKAGAKAREAAAVARAKAEVEARLKASRDKEAAKKAKREAASVAKRTYVLSQEYTREKLAFTMRGRWGGEYRVIPEATSTLTYTERIVRNKAESMGAFQRRATRIARQHIIDMDTDMGFGGETIFKHTAVGGATLSQGGGGGMGMSRTKPWAYENSGFYSIAEEGKCVPNSLKQLYPKRSYDYFVRNLFPDGDDTQPCLAEWILDWAMRCDITVIGCDENYNILKGEVSGSPIEYYSRNSNNKALYFVKKDTHFYVMDREKALSIVRSRSNSIKMKKEEKEEKVERVKVFMEKDLIEIDFVAHENKHLIVREVSYVKSYLLEYMRIFHAVPKMQFAVRGENSIYLKSFCFGNNNKLSFDPHYNTVKVVSEKLNIPVDSMRSISDEYALQTVGVIPKSFMNNQVMDIFLKWKSSQHYCNLPLGPISWNKVNGVEQTWDMNKQYTSILRNSSMKWLLFDMFSIPMPYSGSIGDAYYFIETDNTLPCKGNGWYSRIIAEYLIKNGIQHTITYEIKACRTLEPGVFAPFVDKVMADVSDGFKYITNTFCGALNTHDKKTASVQATTEKAVVIEKCLTKGASMCKFEVGDETIFCAATIKKDVLTENNMPMFSQILDTSAVILAEAIKHLEAKGCIIRSYKTDSITFKHTDKLEIDLPTCVLGGWKSEEPKPFEYQIKPMKRTDVFTAPEYSFVEDKKEEDFADGEIVDYLSTHSCFVEAPAGYGKSWIAERVIEKVEADKCCVLGYTNIAANNIGGSTFHKTFKISIDDYKGVIPIKEIMKDKDILIVDEISQVPAKLYKIIEDVKKMGKRVLIFGDLKQILPIGEESDGLTMLKILCENRIVLTKYKRGDAELLDALIKVRERRCIPFDQLEKGGLHFCFTKTMRDKINERELMKVKKGYFDLVANDNLKRIYVGMPLRSTITKADSSMLNGERWTIKKIEEEYVVLKSLIRDDTELVVEYGEIHKTFLPGYAMTIHSSQGLTIKEPYTVHIEERTAFSKEEMWRMIYTAVSRSCKKEQVGVVFH
jgi:nucleoside-triphosphatase THEP1